MSYYIVYDLGKPCFQLTCIPSSLLWNPRSSIAGAISEYAYPGSTSSRPFETIDERIVHITTPTRKFSYYGPFDSVDELSSYIDNHPELFI